MDDNNFENDQEFLNNINSTLLVNKDFDEKEFNYEWLDILEDVCPYIDNILRNPKRFIVNDEEVVKIELARKVTVESVIHLSQHTNLIQKIEDNGDVKPSKILNINKEESLDTYENRFIFTLINNLMVFFDQRVKETSGHSYCKNNCDLKYEANSKVNSENISISITLSDSNKVLKESSGDNGNISYADRLKAIKKLIDGFTSNELYKTLAKLHVSPVRSPIKKTNVILKNPNFRKAEELWNYIQTYVTKDVIVKDKRDYFDNGVLKNEYDQAFLATFIANKNYINSSKGNNERTIVNQMMQRLINNLLDTDIDLTEDKIKELFIKQIDNIKESNIKKYDTLIGIFSNKLDKEINDLNNILDLMRKEA